MNLLAIDASTEACSVAIKYQDKVYNEFELCPQSHSVVLLPMVDRLLKTSGAKLSDFDALIYGRGPGSFTGVRIGIGVAQGLAFSADMPTVGISTMQTMAQQAFEQGASDKVLVAIDARMSEIYTAEYEKNAQGQAMLLGAERVVAPADIEQTLSKHDESSTYHAVGTGWEAYSEQLLLLHDNDVTLLYPNAKYMLSLGEVAFVNGEALPAEQAQPVYVRDTVSWKKLPGRE